jgi:hypothetical protein
MNGRSFAGTTRRVWSMICVGVVVVAATQLPASAAGEQLWAKRYDGSAHLGGAGASVAVSPDGTKAFAGGIANTSNGWYDFVVIAYVPATGARLWVKKYNGPADSGDNIVDIAVSPDSARVYVTGLSFSSATADDFFTIAYDAASGATIWKRRWDVFTGQGSLDNPSALAIAPDGATLYVTGTSLNWGDFLATNVYATIAYDAATGAKRWSQTYDGPSNSDDDAFDVAVSPDSATAFVTGSSRGSTSGPDFGTIAYDASTGAINWLKRYNGPANGLDAGRAITAQDAAVVVTGDSQGDATTIAYDPSTGARLWAKRFGGSGPSAASSLASTPAAVFVSGWSTRTATGDDYVTIAYDVASGSQLWVKLYNGPVDGADYSHGTAVDADGAKVFVTGESAGTAGLDYATVAYDALSGVRLFKARYNGPGDGDDAGSSIAAVPDGSEAVVTGTSMGTAHYQLTTVAYAA